MGSNLFYQGRLGNLMCQYGTLLAHAFRIGATPILSYQEPILQNVLSTHPTEPYIFHARLPKQQFYSYLHGLAQRY